jgi:putative hydrolase of the HAD superfamily
MYAIIFDMDDTLYKERHYRDSGYRTIAQHFAASCGMEPDDLYSIMLSDTARAFETIEDMAAKRGVTVTVADQLAVYRSHRPEIKLDADAELVLTELKKRGHRLGLITDGRAWGQLNKIAALQLDRFFDSELTMATVLMNTDKHSTKPYELMQERVGNVDGLVYVGDNPEKDFTHPNMMGWRTIMLRDVNSENIHHQCIGEYPAENRPQTVIETLTTLLQIYK